MAALDPGDAVTYAISIEAINGLWLRTEATVHLRPGETPYAAWGRAQSFADMVLRHHASILPEEMRAERAAALGLEA